MQEMDNMKRQLKNNISKLISDGKLKQVKQLINEYESIVQNDVEIYSIKAVIFIMENDFNKAKEILLQGLSIDDINFDINYNLAYVYEIQENFNEALKHYSKALKECNDENLKLNIEESMIKLQKEYGAKIELPKMKLAFFVKQGMDSFLGDVIEGLSSEYETKKIVVTEYDQVDEGMKWADICWFEWCDELIGYGSRLDLARDKKIICRLHSYEAFADYPNNVNWENVDKFIIDTKHISDVVLTRFENVPKDKINIIPVGVEVCKYKFEKRIKGFDLAYVGYINYKKGPMLLIQLINELVKVDKRYKLHLAGKFQDYRDVLYFNQMIREMNLSSNIIYYGWVEDVDKWLEDKNYIISTSLLEGQHLSIMEGMCKGIKPIIHNFVGAKEIYNEEYVWNSIDEAIKIIRNNEYNSNKYREYIAKNYSKDTELKEIKEIFLHMTREYKNINLLENKPLVTVGVFNYNYKHYLNEAVLSILNQTYDNIEIIIVDDCSNDGSIEKINEYKNTYNNVKGIYHEKNSGSIVKACRELIEQAKGQYLFFLSADDFMKDKFVVEDLVKQFLKDPNLDYVYGNLDIVDSDGKYKDVWKYSQFTDEQIIRETFKRMGSGIMPVTIGMYNIDFYRKNNITWHHDEGNIVAGDVLNSLINIKYGWKYKYIDRSCVCYRHHSNNMTYNLKDRIPSIISVIEYIINNFGESIYLPEEGFDKIQSKKVKKCRKMYKIAEFYFGVLKYYKDGFRPWDGSNINFSNEYIYEWVEKPIYLKVKEYMDKCSQIGDFYKDEVEKLRLNLKN